MTHSEDNKLVINQAPSKQIKRRSAKGHPRPYKDGNRWKAKGYYLDLDGKQQSATGTGSTQRAAIARRDELIKERLAEQQESRIPDDASAVGAYCRFWLDKVKQPQDPVSYKTYQDYDSVLRNWIVPRIGKIKLTELKRIDIITLFDAIRKAGKSKTVQIQVKAVLGPALKYALAEQHITYNPFINIKLMKVQTKAPEYFEFDEASCIMKAAKVLNEELKWDLALSYALRQGERLGLTWDDLDLNSKQPY